MLFGVSNIFRLDKFSLYNQTFDPENHSLSSSDINLNFVFWSIGNLNTWKVKLCPVSKTVVSWLFQQFWCLGPNQRTIQIQWRTETNRRNMKDAVVFEIKDSKSRLGESTAS